MKKLLLLIAIMLSISNIIAQTPDFIRTRPVGDQNVIDARLKADLSFQLPKASTTTLNGAKDQSGYLMYNTSLNKVALYKGASSWQLFNAENWDLSYSWGNHAGLYKSISYVPTWGEITSKPTFATVAYTGDYNDLINKPPGFTHSVSDWTIPVSNGTTFINSNMRTDGETIGFGKHPSGSSGYSIQAKYAIHTETDLYARDAIVNDEVYSSLWNGNESVPTKNAVYDKIESIIGTIPTGGITDTTGLYRKTGGKITGVFSVVNGSNEDIFSVNKVSTDRTYIKNLRLNYPKGYLLKTDLLGVVSPAISDVDYVNPSALNSYVLKSYTLDTGYGLIGGGNFTAPRTISIDTSAIDSRYYKKSEIDAMISGGGSATSGTYLPTLVNSYKTSYTDFKPSHWTITGNMLDVQGAVILTTTTTGTPEEVSMEITLPPGITPAFDTLYDASGHGTPIDFGNVKGMHVKANASSGNVILTLWNQNSLTMEYRYSFKAKISTSTTLE